MIKSALNYTGNKFDLLKDIIPIFPKVSKFADIFCGSLTVGINVNADIVYANDKSKPIIEIYEYFKNHNISKTFNEIKSIISYYELRKTNREGYLQLRNDYNHNKEPLKLFVLSCYSFNNIIRFNNNSDFNTSFGKDRSKFNSETELKLLNFVRYLQNKNIIFTSKDFREFNYNDIDLVYCDPPYLISSAEYNSGWGENEDLELMKILDDINQKGKLFALSNVLEHKGLVNENLKKWAYKYNVILLNKNYNNSYNHVKNKNNFLTKEVLITNFTNFNTDLEW